MKNMESRRGLAMPVILLVVLLVVVAGGVYYYMQKPSGTPIPTGNTNSIEGTYPVGTDIPDTPETATSTDGNNTNAPIVDVPGAKVFAVAGSNFAFDTKEIRVKKGDVVTINFTNTAGFHDWVLDEFNAKTAQLQAGATATVTFTADKTGTFEYYCSVGQHRKMGMVGNLIVE